MTSFLEKTPDYDKIKKLALAKENVLGKNEDNPDLPGKYIYDKILLPTKGLEELNLVFYERRALDYAWKDYNARLNTFRKTGTDFGDYCAAFAQAFGNNVKTEKELLGHLWIEDLLDKVKEDLKLDFSLRYSWLNPRLNKGLHEHYVSLGKPIKTFFE